MVHASCTNTGRLSNKRQASNTCQGSEPFVPTDTKELQYMLYLQLRFGHKGFSSTSDNQRWLEQLSCLSSTNTSKSSKNSPLLLLFKPFIILNNWIKSLRKGTVDGYSTDKGEESDVIVWKAHLPHPSAFYTLPVPPLLSMSNTVAVKLTQLNSTNHPKEKSGLQEERSYKSLYKSPILQ